MEKYIWKGERLKARRKGLGLTTDELAQRIGTQHNHITMWEKDKCDPSGSYLVTLCEALKIDPKSLYDKVGQDNANTLTLNATA